jgi:hypothetical protein
MNVFCFKIVYTRTKHPLSAAGATRYAFAPLFHVTSVTLACYRLSSHRCFKMRLFLRIAPPEFLDNFMGLAPLSLKLLLFQ